MDLRCRQRSGRRLMEDRAHAGGPHGCARARRGERRAQRPDGGTHSHAESHPEYTSEYPDSHGLTYDLVDHPSAVRPTDRPKSADLPDPLGDARQASATRGDQEGGQQHDHQPAPRRGALASVCAFGQAPRDLSRPGSPTVSIRGARQSPCRIAAATAHTSEDFATSTSTSLTRASGWRPGRLQAGRGSK